MIAIVDYGLGNIKAFANVYKRLNIDYVIASDTETLSLASKIILPGVGAFDYAMHKLEISGLRPCLDHLVLNKKVPVLGVCVGMQLMADASEEGSSKGLGWINGTVRRIANPDTMHHAKLPLPHMGWNEIVPVNNSDLLNGLDDEKRFYFLHSYFFECLNSQNVIAKTSYGAEFTCFVNRNNIYGIQCHPEKSHINGMILLKNFASI